MRTASPLVPAGAVWLGTLLAVIAVAAGGSWPVTAHGYYAGWLVAVSLPLGALPVLMVLDLLDVSETPVRTALRLLLAALPVLALLLVPVLLDLKAVFPWPAGTVLAPGSSAPLKGLAKAWFTPGFFGLRSVVYLLTWVVLALFFVRPAPASARHRTIAGIGLVLHLVIGTLAAFDWWMSLDQAFLSSVYGLLVIVSQAAFAMIVASLVALATGRGTPLERPLLLSLLVVLLSAAFLQFSQYLVVWSANLPKEIAWYQARWVGPLAPTFVVATPILLVLALVVLAPAALAALRIPAVAALATLLLVAVTDLACLASPRETFTFAGLALDIAFLIVVGGLGAVCAVVLSGSGRRPHHG